MVRALSRAHEEGRADRPIRVDDGIRAGITAANSFADNKTASTSALL
jgi:hypothetical protein